MLYLRATPPVNSMPPIGSPPEEIVTYPLELLRCARCTLVQLGVEVSPEILFPPEYPYRSASTKVLRDNFAELRVEATNLINLKLDDLVVDIGSNDGTLLSNFKESGQRVLGVEPSLAAKTAEDRGVPSLMEFFTPELVSSILHGHGAARLVTATNVFAHMSGIDELLAAIVGLLAPDGVFVSESHYLPALVETVQYDTVYHEHLRYYSLASLTWLLRRGGLEVFHAKEIPTHGGSVRVYAARPGAFSVQPTVAGLQRSEDAAGITDGSALTSFRHRVHQSKLDLLALLAPLRREGARVVGIGAPSRASTLLSFTGLDEGVLDYIAEVSTSEKIGRLMPGTRIPVLDEKVLYEDQPEYALLLSWHIADELMANLRRKGYRGKFIIPLPEPHLVHD